MKLKSAVVGLVATGFLGCASAAFSLQAASAQEGSELRVSTMSEPTSYDPIGGTSGADHLVLYATYDTLIDYTPDTLEAAPGLAESWDTSDPTTIVLKLRDGVKFHDGSKFDAEVVKYNLDRVRAEGSILASNVSSISEVNVIDPLTVEIKLSHPDAGLLLILADRPGMMVPKDVNTEELAKHPIGTGPWMFVSSRRDQQTEMKANPDYWGGKVAVENLTYRYIANATTRCSALLSGQIDFATHLPVSCISSMEKDPELAVWAEPTTGIRNVSFNLTIKPFDDIRVRQALSLATNRDDVAKAEFGKSLPAGAFLPPAHWAAPKDAEIAYDPEQAKALLKEAGFENGLSFDFLVYPIFSRIGEVLKENWAQVGVDAKIVTPELKQAINDFYSDRRYGILLGNWSGRPDPAQTLFALFGKESFYNAGRAETPGFEQAMQKQAAATDKSERADLLREAQEDIRKNVVAFPVDHPFLVLGYRKDVKGISFNLYGKPKFTAARIEKSE